MKRVEAFLSHTSQDGAFAARLAAVLSHHGVGTFFSKKSIRGAQQWHDEIGRALRRCNWFLLVLSPSSVRSAWVRHELVYALRERRYREHIAPLLLKTCRTDQLSWTIGSFQRIDFRGRFEDACRELLALWGIDYRPARAKSDRDKGAKSHLARRRATRRRTSEP